MDANTLPSSVRKYVTQLHMHFLYALALYTLHWAMGKDVPHLFPFLLLSHDLDCRGRRLSSSINSIGKGSGFFLRPPERGGLPNQNKAFNRCLFGQRFNVCKDHAGWALGFKKMKPHCRTSFVYLFLNDDNHEKSPPPPMRTRSNFVGSGLESMAENWPGWPAIMEHVFHDHKAVKWQPLSQPSDHPGYHFRKAVLWISQTNQHPPESSLGF